MQLNTFCFLPLYKPVGPTSHDMVDVVRKLVPKKVKVGHTGTLDPFASGVLIMAVGKATRFADDVHELPKSYKALLRLGVQTDTLDPTGEVIKESPIPAVEKAQLRQLEKDFLGTLSQTPPVFSAKKVGGRKSYELARENKVVELKPRDIVIHGLKLEQVDHKTISIDVNCSTGTYVRALGRDLAEALGSCGHLLELERTSVGSISHKDCVTPPVLNEDNLSRYAVSVSRLLKNYPEIPLPPEALALLSQGRPYPIEERAPMSFLGTFPDEFGRIKAIYKCSYDPETSAILSRMQCYMQEG